MKQENSALNNLRLLSEDKLEQQLSNLDSVEINDITLPSLTGLTNNSLTNNKLCHLKTQPSHSMSPHFKKRKNSQIAGWDFENNPFLSDEQLLPLNVTISYQSKTTLADSYLDQK